MEESIRVLYVDDEPHLLDLGKIFLQKRGGFTVTTAESGISGLACLAADPVDVIVSDYQMPGMDGIGFVKEVRRMYGELPFILFTGRGREEVVIEAINNGVDFYLQKGGDAKSQFAELAHKIRQADKKYRVEQALRRSEERYRSVVNDQEDLIARFTPSGVVTFVNRAFQDYFGAILEIEDFMGKSIHDLMRDRNIPAVELFLSNITQNDPVSQAEKMVVTQKGEQHWQLWSVRALFGENGIAREYQVVGRDISRQKKTEEELRAAYGQLAAQEEELRRQYRLLEEHESVLAEREAAYRTIFEQSPAAITFSTMTGEYVDVNKLFCELVDLPRSALIGKSPKEIWPSLESDDLKEIIEIFENSEGVLDKKHMKIPFRGGPPRDCRISSQVVQYHGKPHIIALIYDIEHVSST
jgi:PAS domain S-box-containing protein